MKNQENQEKLEKNQENLEENLRNYIEYDFNEILYKSISWPPTAKLINREDNLGPPPLTRQNNFVINISKYLEMQQNSQVETSINLE